MYRCYSTSVRICPFWCSYSVVSLVYIHSNILSFHYFNLLAKILKKSLIPRVATFLCHNPFPFSLSLFVLLCYLSLFPSLSIFQCMPNASLLLDFLNFTIYQFLQENVLVFNVILFNNLLSSHQGRNICQKKNFFL